MLGLVQRLRPFYAGSFMADWRRLSASTNAEQIRAVSGAYPATFGMTVAAVISLLCVSKAGRHAIAIDLAAVILIAVSIVTLAGWFKDRARDWCIDDAARRRRGLCLQASVTSLAWYSFLGAVGVSAGGDDRAVVDCIMGGVLSAGALRYAAVPAASFSFIGAGLAAITAYALLVGLPMQIFVMLFIMTGLLLKSVLGQALLVLNNQRAARELMDAAIAREKAKAAVDRSDLIRARRDHELRREASETRTAELDAISRHFQTSVFALVAELTQRAMRGREVADAFGSLTERWKGGTTRLLSHAKETSLESGELVDYASNLSGSLEQLRQRIGAQTQVSARVQAGFNANEDAATLLVERAEKIRKILTLIGNIANRTRLLALNASIEAAKAGEAGRGFTIVAQEVKALAVQTRQATEEVTVQIGSMREAIEDVTRSLSMVRSDFGSIHLVTASLDDAMAGQRALIEGVEHRAAAAAGLHATLDEQASAAAVDVGHASMLSADLKSSAQEIADRCTGLLDAMQLFIQDLGLGQSGALKRAA